MELTVKKAVKDLTVSECKEYCKEFRRLKGCSCESKGCLLIERHICFDYVHEWDDSKTPSLTNAEIGICESVGAKYVTKNDTRFDPEMTVKLWKKKPVKSYGCWKNRFDIEDDYIGTVKSSLFPSVMAGGIVQVYAEGEEANGGKQDDR